MSKRWTIGLDVGTHEVRFACLSTSADKRELMAYARISRLETAAIRAALETPAIRNGEVRVGIRDPHLVIQQVDIPKVPDEEVDEIIKWAVKDLPNPVDQYVFDHHMLGALEGNGKIAYNAFALDKTFVKQREQEIHDLGVGQISVMEPDINALAVCVCANYDLQANDRYAIIDLGHTIGTFAVISTNGIWSVQDISIASGGALTKLLGESVKITTPDLLKSEHASDVIQYLTTASIAVQKSIDSYMIDHANEPITHFLLSGGASNLNVLQPYIQDTLKIPTRVLDPFQGIDTHRFDKSNLDENRAYFGTAIGLAL